MSEIEKAIEQLNAELTDLVVIKESTFLLYGEKKKNLNDSISIRRIAVQALQEKLERENPKPLGLEELKSLSGEDMPWGIDAKPKNYHGLGSIKGEELGCFVFALPISDEFWNIYSSLGAKYMYKSSDYGKTWIAYRHKPKHIGEATNMVEGE